MKSLALIALCLAASPILASAAGVPAGYTIQKLATVTNDRDAGSFPLSVLVDKNGLAAGLYSGAPEERANPSMWSRDLETAKGAVMINSQGHDVLMIQGTINRVTQEAPMKLTYLSNGLTGTYASCNLNLKHVNNAWYIQNAYTKAKVTNFKIISWGMGLTTLEGLCQK
jgi:hypothetical protein